MAFMFRMAWREVRASWGRLLFFFVCVALGVAAIVVLRSVIQNIRQTVETLSGGQRQGVAVARAVAFGSKVLILDEPTAALGVREGGRVLQLIRDLRERGLPIILISHDIPHLFEVADRVHIQRLGRRVAVISPRTHTMTDAVAIMTGAVRPEDVGAA